MSDQDFAHFLSHLKVYSKFLEGREVGLPAEKARTRLGIGSESPLRVIMCGMGESLMHRKCTDWVKAIRQEIGIRVSIVTNGLLLREKMIQSLKAADITVILVSVPGVSKETYSKTMKIDWDRVMENILQANSALPGRVQINATIPDNAEFTEADVIRFWAERSIPIAGISRCHNRGGFLSDHSLTRRFGIEQGSFCGIIARHNFIAWDGHILSCCHDLHAENKIGHVSTHDFFQIAQLKTPLVSRGPQYRICSGCNDGERRHPQQILISSDISDLVPRPINLSRS